MKKRIQAFSMALVMVFIFVASFLENVTLVRASDLTIKLHYEREDSNYTDWSVWFWVDGIESADIPFAEENGDMVASYSVPQGASNFGFIVRTPEWEKDVDMDQFIDIAECVSGTVHVYVKSGVEGYTKEYGDDVVKGVKISNASYDGSRIRVTMAGSLEDAAGAFSVVSSDGNEVAIKAVDGMGAIYTLEPENPLEFAKQYAVIYAGNSYEILMPDYYGTEEFESAYTYVGNDLGANWTKDATTFRVWAPMAEVVSVNLYKSGDSAVEDLVESLPMTADVNGTWVMTKNGDLNGVYYTYIVTNNGTSEEACDPYARTTGVNGQRAMVIDLTSTNPEGWEEDKNPNADKTFNDAVIYELHIRDLGTHESSGITNAGKYLSLIEHGTTTAGGAATGVDHMKDLGITHLHILPMYDYGSVNETKLDTAQFNWGYDPVNYNVPEGSYSTDPYHGEVRVKEVKQMVQSLHNDGISVIMDVVYNHVFDAGNFCFNKIVPDYFSRKTNGTYSNGSACGNDTASERAMVKKYIVDSVLYWATEYHIDGFRFDLVGLIDTETINEVMEAVHAVRPDVVFYGEGWTMNTTVTKSGYSMTTQPNSTMVPGFAFFSDTLRDGLKGSVFNGTDKGYVSGASKLEGVIEDCFLGLSGTWCTTPAQSINYASCHDNNTLYDRLQMSCPDATQEELIKMNNLSAAIYMTAQGIPFIHAGEEMLRTKVNADGSFNENSYNATDEVNNIKWNTLEDPVYADVADYYKGLIAFRKAHPVLCLTTAEDVAKYVSVVDMEDANVTAFSVAGGLEGETADAMYIVFNPNKEAKEITLPQGEWHVCINGETAGVESLETVSGTATVDGISALVLVQEEVAAATTDSDKGNLGELVPYLGVAGACIAASIVKRRKNK